LKIIFNNNNNKVKNIPLKKHIITKEYIHKTCIDAVFSSTVAYMTTFYYSHLIINCFWIVRMLIYCLSYLC